MNKIPRYAENLRDAAVFRKNGFQIWCRQLYVQNFRFIFLLFWSGGCDKNTRLYPGKIIIKDSIKMGYLIITHNSQTN